MPFRSGPTTSSCPRLDPVHGIVFLPGTVSESATPDRSALPRRRVEKAPVPGSECRAGQAFVIGMAWVHSSHGGQANERGRERLSIPLGGWNLPAQNSWPSAQTLAPWGATRQSFLLSLGIPN